MDVFFDIQFITGIILVLIGIFLLYLVKHGKTELVIQGQERLTIKNSVSYFFHSSWNF